MEDITMSSLQLLTSYGAMGTCLIYFIFKDFSVTKKLNDTINDFTVMMDTFFKLNVNTNTSRGAEK